jgi:hypothetical protein
VRFRRVCKRPLKNPKNPKPMAAAGFSRAPLTRALSTAWYACAAQLQCLCCSVSVTQGIPCCLMLPGCRAWRTWPVTLRGTCGTCRSRAGWGPGHAAGWLIGCAVAASVQLHVLQGMRSRDDIVEITARDVMLVRLAGGCPGSLPACCTSPVQPALGALHAGLCHDIGHGVMPDQLQCNNNLCAGASPAPPCPAALLTCF